MVWVKSLVVWLNHESFQSNWQGTFIRRLPLFPCRSEGAQFSWPSQSKSMGDEFFTSAPLWMLEKTTTQTSTVGGGGTRIYGFLSQLEFLPWLKSVLSSPIILYLSGVATNQNREYKPISEASETAQKQTFSQHWKQPSEHGRLYKSSTLCFWIDYW